MKILLVHNAYGIFTGEEMVVTLLHRLLKERGHEVIPFLRSSEDIPNMRFGKVRAVFRPKAALLSKATLPTSGK